MLISDILFNIPTIFILEKDHALHLYMYYMYLFMALKSPNNCYTYNEAENWKIVQQIISRVNINIQKNNFLDPHVPLVVSLHSNRYFLKNLHSFWILTHCATRATSMIKIMWHRMRTKISFFEANSHDKSFLYKYIQ